MVLVQFNPLNSTVPLFEFVHVWGKNTFKQD